MSLAAVANQIAIALCRRAQAATERDLDEQRTPRRFHAKWSALRDGRAGAIPHWFSYRGGSHRVLDSSRFVPFVKRCEHRPWMTPSSCEGRNPSMLSDTRVIAVCCPE
jgi:hypothetical protein